MQRDSSHHNPKPNSMCHCDHQENEMKSNLNISKKYQQFKFI